MTPARTVATARRTRAATVITEITSPTVLAPAVLIAVAVHTEIRQQRGAIWWGLLAAVFVGAIPLAFLKLGVRKGRWADHHVRSRELRLVPLIVAACSVACGLALLLGGHAPNDITALVVAMLAGLISVLVVSRWWKVSIHAAVAGGTAIILAAVFGLPGLVIGIVGVVCAAWSRVASGDHSASQALTGVVIGAVAALLYLPLR